MALSFPDIWGQLVAAYGPAAGKADFHKVYPETFWDQIKAVLEQGSITGDGVYVVTDPQFGAVGDGVTDDTAAIQAAIDAAEAAGGGTVYFPPGTYLLDEIVVHGGVELVGAGVGGDMAAASTTESVVTLLASPNVTLSDAFISFEPADPADLAIGCGMHGFTLRSQSSNPAAMVRLTGVQFSRFSWIRWFDGAGGERQLELRPRQTAVGSISSFSGWNTFDHLRFGSAATTGACIYLDGETGEGACTQNTFRDVYLGHGAYGIYFDGNVDNNRFHQVHSVTGTLANSSVYMANGATAFPRHNVFFNFIGTVDLESDAEGNEWHYTSSEGSAFRAGANTKVNTWECKDYGNARVFRTPIYQIQDRRYYPASLLSAASGSPSSDLIASLYGVPWNLDPASNESVGGVVDLPNEWGNGDITGVELFYNPASGDDGTAVKFDVTVKANPPDSGFGGTATTGTVTDAITVSAASANEIDVATVTFGTPAPYAIGSLVAINIERDAADVADTAAGDVGLVGFRLIFKGDGPITATGGGSQTWDGTAY